MSRNKIKFNKEIKKQIEILFNQETINNYLLTYNIKNLDQLFERYYYINTKKNIYKEVKIGNNDCNCPKCKNYGYIDKIINYNKKNNKITLAKDNSISLIANETNKKKNKINLAKDNIITLILNETNKKNLNKNNNSNKNNENGDILKYLRKGNIAPKDTEE